MAEVSESQKPEFEGELRDWSYSRTAMVVRHINCHDERYPVIKGEDIANILVTEYKIEICWKDVSRPALIFILKENFVDTD